MLVFDQLKKNDPQLRAVAVVILAGLLLLGGGLWWTQIVSGRDYRESLETQAYRTIRIPAVRGEILDRNGTALAENRPTYNASLYLEELRESFASEYGRIRPVQMVKASAPFWHWWKESPVVKTQRVKLSREQIQALAWTARCRVASNIVTEVSHRLHQPIAFNEAEFKNHYLKRLALPFPLLTDMDPTNISRFAEQSTGTLGLDMDVQSTRAYPFGTTAAHLLGYLRRDDSSAEGEESYFYYRLPDFRGMVGIEYGYDKVLRGQAGAKSVQVNNIGYRQNENVWSPAEAGQNVVLTIELAIQQAAERALQNAQVPYPAPVRGAAVVMDALSGDILALASSPTFNPNWYLQGMTREQYHDRITALNAELNRATYGAYPPGSIFKTVVGMAALEAGLNPQQIYDVPPNPEQPNKGVIYVGPGHRKVRDTAPPGEYDFRRALKLSCNSYFITNGILTGVERIVRLGQRLHLGEGLRLPTHQEVAGYFPGLKQVRSRWTDGNTANLSIGQDPVLMTPLQVAVLTSAIANGGKVLWPRLVTRIEPQDPLSGEPPSVFPPLPPRDELGVSTRTLSVMHDAMLADTEDSDGTGRHVRDREPLPGLHICGKTGTAQLQDERNRKTGQITWFASFAALGTGSGKTCYTVVVMVEDGVAGGDTCAPVAGHIYAALLDRQRTPPRKAGALAQGQ